ncbi:MAG: RadC family protein [Oscillospiraceae bacterium]|nr:RadC family protein [Oscillospiraceae bacterium]
MSIHDGHRDRMKNRFLEEGLDNFEEHQVLELLLFYCIPRRDTNPVAHALIDHFGSFSAVLDAPVEELKKISGISDNAATFLTLMGQSWRYYQVNRSMQPDVILTTVEKCGEYLMPFFSGKQNETVYLLCLDAKCKVRCCKEVGEGGVNSAAVPIRKIVETAMSNNASSVVLAHNHPSGLALPSGDDINTTRRVAAALDAVEITLVDHIIVADDDFVSLAQSGVYRHEECRVLL